MPVFVPYDEREVTLVAIDISKARHDILIQFPNGKRKKLKLTSTAKDYHSLKDYHSFIQQLKSLTFPALLD